MPSSLAILHLFKFLKTIPLKPTGKHHENKSQVVHTSDTGNLPKSLIKMLYKVSAEIL